MTYNIFCFFVIVYIFVVIAYLIDDYLDQPPTAILHFKLIL